MRVIIGPLAGVVVALLVAGCSSPSTSPPPPSPSAFASATALRARLGDEFPQSLQKDLTTLPGAETCDVLVYDPYGSSEASAGTHMDRVLFVVYPSAPDAQALSQADELVYQDSSYGEALYRLSGANWVIWSNSRPALVDYRRSIGGTLVLVKPASG